MKVGDVRLDDINIERESSKKKIVCALKEIRELQKQRTAIDNKLIKAKEESRKLKLEYFGNLLTLGDEA